MAYRSLLSDEVISPQRRQARKSPAMLQDECDRLAAECAQLQRDLKAQSAAAETAMAFAAKVQATPLTVTVAESKPDPRIAIIQESLRAMGDRLAELSIAVEGARIAAGARPDPVVVPPAPVPAINVTAPPVNMTMIVETIRQELARSEQADTGQIALNVTVVERDGNGNIKTFSIQGAKS